MRRQNSAPLSAPGVKRLETIAALAVRMRETVRRLSQACESNEGRARSFNQHLIWAPPTTNLAPQQQNEGRLASPATKKKASFRTK